MQFLEVINGTSWNINIRSADLDVSVTHCNDKIIEIEIDFGDLVITFPIFIIDDTVLAPLLESLFDYPSLTFGKVTFINHNNNGLLFV